MPRETRETVIERILDAAIECVLTYGVDNVQMTQIAARAEMSARTLNRYYQEKESLLADAATKYLYRAYDSFVANFIKLPKDGLNGKQKLLLFLSSQKDYFKTSTIEAMLMVDMRFYRVRHIDAKTSWSIKGNERVRDVVTDCLKEGAADGSIRIGLDPLATSVLIAATYNGVMQRLTLTYRSNVSEEYKTEVYRIFDEYIKMVDKYLSRG